MTKLRDVLTCNGEVAYRSVQQSTGEAKSCYMRYWYNTVQSSLAESIYLENISGHMPRYIFSIILFFDNYIINML